MLEALIDEGEDAALRLHHRLAGWFDEAMDRITGWYKRRATLLIFAFAAALTVATNASTIHVAEELWRNAALRAAIAVPFQELDDTRYPVVPLADLRLDDFDAITRPRDETDPPGRREVDRLLTW